VRMREWEGIETVSTLVWWAIPIVITAIAVAVVSLRSRMVDPRTDPMADRARLREAMERPIPRTHRGPTSE
jgi:cytochrome c-type biogenesis protein CcmH/NrfF